LTTDDAPSESSSLPEVLVPGSELGIIDKACGKGQSKVENVSARKYSDPHTSDNKKRGSFAQERRRANGGRWMPKKESEIYCDRIYGGRVTLL